VEQLLDYGFAGALIAFIVVPIINKLMKGQQKQNDEIIKALKEGLSGISDALKAHDAEDQESFKDIKQSIVDESIRTRMSLGNTILNEKQAVSMLLEKMWFVSLQKLDFIRTQLKICKHEMTEEEREPIKRRIQSELERKSQLYMNDFQEFITPIGTLDDWLNENFGQKDFDRLLAKIHKIMFRKRRPELTEKQCIEVKIDEISSEMKHLQNTLATKLKVDLKIFK